MRISKLTSFAIILLLMGERGMGEREREFPSEALSFPAAGSLKRQLVSPKRGRAGNNKATQVKSHLTLPKVSVFLRFYIPGDQTTLTQGPNGCPRS